MGIFDAIVLGVVQGLTEFLPISSSGHLIIARDLLGLQTADGLSFDAVLHFATAGAVLIYFRHDFIRLARAAARSWVLRKPIEQTIKTLLVALLIGTVPAVVFGLLLETIMDTLFRSALLVAVVLIIGSGIMYAAERSARRIPMKTTITVRKGLAIGFFQALALIPGMSRSGMTIAGGLLLGLSRVEAARFGFLLSFPVVLGAGAKKLLELSANGGLTDLGVVLVAGALAAFITGMLVIHYLLKYLTTHSLNVFIIYRVLLAVLVIGYGIVL